ncbi:hypothetical protein KVE59_07635 [Helicobacter pylori]|nr:hypothetical protein KVE59_07635 [Helicobacter pylori]
MEQENLQPIDLEVLKALYKQAYLPKSADKISKYLKIDYLNDLGKDLYTYLNALKSNKPTKKD